MDEGQQSYIDYEAFLDPSFSPVEFANNLVTSTNDASDAQLDLSTPLSRVLFDIQEVDTHIHNLTSKSAIDLLEYTQVQSNASTHIVQEVEAQVAGLTEGYKRLEENVIRRYEVADEVRITVERLWQTVKLGRAVARCLLLGRQLEAQMADIGLSINVAGKLANHKSMVQASHTLLALRFLLEPGPEASLVDLSQIRIIRTLQFDLVVPSEQKIRAKGQQIIREFSMSSLAAQPGPNAQSPLPAAPTFAQAEETKARTASACLTLYLLSPVPTTGRGDFQPMLLLTALQSYLQTALTSSQASLGRALGTLPTLNRTLLEVAARCQNIVALELLLETIKAPAHPLFGHASEKAQGSEEGGLSSGHANLLQPLLSALDTSSLPSFFWRSLASGLAARVQDIVGKGGVSARTLKTQREKVKESIRECVIKGCQGAKVRTESGGWEREVGVMVGSVMGPLGR